MRLDPGPQAGSPVTADWLRARLRSPAELLPEARPVTIPPPPDIGAQADAPTAQGLAGPNPVAAAVLVAFVLGQEPGVLLTRRTGQLSSHAGQVSFPGGRIDPDDAGAEAAALREAREEIGLRPELVEVVGRMDRTLTGTGFSIIPVLGLLPDGREMDTLGLTASPAEVDAMFVLPLAVLMDPQAPQRRRAELRGRWREFWVWPHPDQYIWGATATILVHLAARLRAA